MNIVKSIINKGASMRAGYLPLVKFPALRGILTICALSLAAAAFALASIAQIFARFPAVHGKWLLFVLLCLSLAGLGAVSMYLLHILIPLLREAVRQTAPETAGEGKTDLSGFLIGSIKRNETFAEQESYYQLLQKQAQLKVLQSQINPHFLYNTLDSVRGLALDEGAVRSAEMAEDLAVLFRYSIGNAADVVTIAEELQNVRTYIQIMDYRFNSRYHFSIENETALDLNRCKIPKLVLQPIIENALFHGLYQKKNSGSVKIRLTASASHLFIDVIDDGIGMDDRTLNKLNTSFKQPALAEISSGDSRSHKSIALANVNMRLRLLYGSEYMLTALSTPDRGTTISIVLPLMEVKNEGNPSSAKSVQTG